MLYRLEGACILGMRLTIPPVSFFHKEKGGMEMLRAGYGCEFAEILACNAYVRLD